MSNAETVAKMAQVLDVSIDYLLRDDFKKDNCTETAIQNNSLLKKFQAIEQINEMIL